MKPWLRNVGPGVLVSAAFIGPGTVTVCSVAGASYSYALLWALLLSIVFCIGLQEMAARLGVVTQDGLSEAIRKEIGHPVLKFLSLLLIFAAIVLGNAAYEAGNISGAVMGVRSFLPAIAISGLPKNLDLWSLVIGGCSFLLLSLGSYKTLEKGFIFLVALMSLSFLSAAVVTQPDPIGILKGLFIPAKASAGLLSVMAIIGTTVVPYNLFLHASLVSQKWNASSLGIARKELVWAIALGGLVSMAIMVTAAASGVGEISSATDLAVGLKPLFGAQATVFLGVGLFAAGITSSITAPLAAAYVVSGCLGWKKDLTSIKFKMVWGSVLLMGVIFSSLGRRPLEIIQFAQIANGILLPIVAVFLFWIVNRPGLMGKYRNNLWQNLFGIVIIGVSLFLGLKSIYNVFEN